MAFTLPSDSIHKLLPFAILLRTEHHRLRTLHLVKSVYGTVQALHLPVAVSIRLNNGYTVFQYGFSGTNCSNELWMKRKENTVRMMEMSSLRLYMLLKLKQETLEDRGLNGKDYVARGGAFPIRVEGVGVIGSVIVSGLDHMADHDFAVACISQYLRIDNIPRLPVNN